MSSTARFGIDDWAAIELVVFDVDGTLYEQRRLRLQMARDMALHVVRTRSLDVPAVISRYRHLREAIGEAERERFEAVLLQQTSEQTGRSETQVRAIVDEWIDRRPLPYLQSCRYPGIVELFAGLKRHGKIVGVLSDYPARAKLAALGLQADLVVSATEPQVGILKPHPRGLLDLMGQASAGPAATLLIGDRLERDGAAAQRAGGASLILTSKARPGWQTFRRFDDAIFAPMLAAG